VQDLFLPGPGEFWSGFVDLVTTGYKGRPLLSHIGFSLEHVLAGFVTGTVAATLSLDALTRETMQVESHDIWWRTAMTVLFITHSVEEAVVLGTDVVVMSPRRGRILEHVRLPFARAADGRDNRTVKSLPVFVAAREQILSLIWRSADEP
jgi:hypothetical protein